MADAIVLLAVVPSAIAPLTDCISHSLLLLISCSDGILCLIILAADTLADTRLASNTLLEADAVELAALATLAVAVFGPSLISSVLHDRRYFLRIIKSLLRRSGIEFLA